jgi:2-amino-4-hydroxy-6-hydroxymethyldihydropteridine diphosphokinase
VKTVVIGLGSNLGDRHAALAFAADRLRTLIPTLILSSVIETEPVGEGLQNQPMYLNAVGVGETALPARDLLNALMAIEHGYGRERPYPGAARTLDLDLLLLGTDVIDEPGLRVPHPRFRERLFVLGPLAEVAPDLCDPVTGLRVGELLRNLLKRS